MVRKGEGDREKGIFDKVDHFQPFPFVTVQVRTTRPCSLLSVMPSFGGWLHEGVPWSVCLGHTE